MSKNRFIPALEALEGRWCPALTYASDTYGNLTISGTPNGAPNGTLDLKLTADRTLQVTENGALQFSVFVPGNLTIRLTNNNETRGVAAGLTFDLGGYSLGGSLSVNTGFGDDWFDLRNGTIYGNLNVVGTRILDVTDLLVYGNFTGNDGNKNLVSQYTFQAVDITNDFVLTTGENNDIINLNGTTIGRNATASTRGWANIFNLASDSSIGGQLSYTGGNFDDSVALGGRVGGNAIINLGGAENFNQVNLDGYVGGEFRVLGGLGNDNVFVGITAMIRSNVNLYLGNAPTGGGNVVDFQGTMCGNTFTYTGDVGADYLFLGGDMTSTRVSANLGAGQDYVQVDTSLVSLYVDFGFGTDSFVINVPRTFPITLRNLP